MRSGAASRPIDGALFGIKAAVLVIVVEALIRIGRRALKTAAAARARRRSAFVGIFFLALPFPADRRGRGADRLFRGAHARRSSSALTARRRDSRAPAAGPLAAVLRRRGRSGWSLWWAPVALAALAARPATTCWSASALFFSKLAVVSFGGAYAVLAYMAQQAVETHHWMTAPEMVDGLGLAETTPGPLILVTQFVGFLAAFRDAAPFSPVAAGVLGAAMTTWVTFVPSMLWIFAGAPFVEQLRANRRLVRRARRHHRRRGRRHPQSVGLVRAARAVRQVHRDARRTAALVRLRSARARSRAPRRWRPIAAVLAFGLHRGLIEVVAVMAALGIVVQYRCC